MTNFLSDPELSKKIRNMDIDSLRSLAEEVRLSIIDAVIRCGGHLSSGLGAVELIIAVHYVFDLPVDKLIFDVGHQAYAHKLLTGRADRFQNELRKLDGIGAFIKRGESEYDVFTTGHAGNSLSLGVGLARARDITGDNYNVISLVGDSSLTNGLNFEAMNDCGSRPTKHIVILNDNDMSISKAVGAVSSKLTLLRQNTFYKRVKKSAIKLIGADNNRDGFVFLKKIKNSLKYMVTNGVLFEEFGYKYLGPVDGHNIGELINALNIAKAETEPVIVHVVTKKGKGCKEAEERPDVYHGIKSKLVEKDCRQSYSDVFGKKMAELADLDDKVVAVCAGMPDGVGLKSFASSHPDRFFDVGIAEEHAVTMSAGLCEGGLKPYVSLYSTFLQRAFDELVHDVALQKLPVRVFVDRAGITGEDGETHQGIFDVAFLSTIPGINIWSPASISEFKQMIDLSLDSNVPLVVRYPKGCDDNDCFDNFVPGKWSILGDEKSDIYIVGSGAAVIAQCIEAKAILEKEGFNIAVVNASTIKPIDYDTVNKFNGKKVIVVEDNVERGGLCEAISVCQRYDLVFKILPVNTGDCFIKQGTVAQLQEIFGVSAQKIAQKAREFLKNS